MKKYELTVLISPELTEDEVRKVEDKISSLIGLSTPDKRSLGYEINKKYKQAYVMDIRFSMEVDSIFDFEKKLKEEDSIIRYLFLRKEEEKPQKERRKREDRPSSDSSHQSRPNNKVELGEIDKKIDEILSE